ncbi:hypothetical protein HK099_006997, partial [Clydaea vesicula]
MDTLDETIILSHEQLHKNNSRYWFGNYARHSKAILAQEKLLKHLKNVKTGLVKVNAADYINTLAINEKKENENVLVLTHGFGAGLGFFHRNYEGLEENLKDWTIYSIDWLGMANSSRPKFPLQNSTLTELENVKIAESFFIDSLENWRKTLNIKKFTLAGHSLGGYLSLSYCEKYPENVEKLILISPAGVGPRPTDEDLKERFRNRSWTFSLAHSIWTRGISPQSIVRRTGWLGQNLVQKYSSRRFSHLSVEELKDFHDYFLHITTQTGSGEYSLSSLLIPGAYAKFPIGERLKKLNIGVSFLYGSDDWMDYKSAVEIANGMAHKPNIVRVLQAGHHLYSDQPAAFNLALIREVKNLETFKKFKDGSGLIYVDIENNKL